MVFPIVAPLDHRGTMVWTILYLHYIGKLSCKFDIFWLSGSGEDFEMIPPHFCIFVIIPFDEDLEPYLLKVVRLRASVNPDVC
jgi:hypothetical protein